MLQFRAWALGVAFAVFAQPASAAWYEAKSRHFTIYSEQRPAELTRYAENLERFDQAVRRLRGMSDPALTDSGRLRIYLLRDQQAVSAMAGQPGGSIAGFYTARASGALAFAHSENGSGGADELKGSTVFFHEYLHHLMLQEMNAALPGWLIEGAAELFATARLQKDGSLNFGYAPQHRAYGMFNLDSLSTEEMVGATREKMSDEDVEQLYGKGWLLTHMLTFDPNRSGQMGRYVNAIQQGLTPLDSARQAFGNLKQLSRDLLNYRDRRRFNGIAVRAEGLKVDAIAVRMLGAGEAAALPVIMQSERGVGPRTAPRVVAEARKISRRFPGDPFVLAALAEAEHDVGDNAAAIAAADKALGLRPDLPKALVLKARAMLSEAGKAPAKADWKAIRALIGRANRLDPDHAEPLLQFYRSFQVQGIVPNKNAIAGLYYAQTLVPQDSSLRITAIYQLLHDNKPAEARAMFGPLAYDPHAGKTRARRLQIMAALADGRTKEAIELLDVLGKDDQPG